MSILAEVEKGHILHQVGSFGLPTAQEAIAKIYEGLLAIGEAACVSVHGANRLGTNSLIDLVVFGKRASITAKEKIKSYKSYSKIEKDYIDKIISRFDNLRNSKGENKVGKIRLKMLKILQKHCGVFRNKETLSKGIEKINDVFDMFNDVSITDKSTIFNTDLVEALELDNLIAQSKVTLASAINRNESRGAHAREDFPNRDDDKWLVHSLTWLREDGNTEFNTRPVHLNTLTNHTQSIPPKKRVY